MVLVLYPSLFTLPTKNQTEFITEYGGYGLKGDWKILGEASVDLTFENEGGYGWIMLGENRYNVEFSKKYTIEKDNEFSIVYEGNITGGEGEVRFAVYKDVVVGEVDVNGTIYSFGAAQTLESAVFMLDLYNEHLEEEALEMGIIKPPPLIDVYVPPGNIPAVIDFDPNVLNFKSNSKWITAYIELLADHSVYDINISTVRLNGIIQAESNPKYGFVKDVYSRISDHDQDGILDCMVKFNSTCVKEMLSWVNEGEIVKLEVTGSLINGEQFYGTGWIKVIGVGKNKNQKYTSMKMDILSQDYSCDAKIAVFNGGPSSWQWKSWFAGMPHNDYAGVISLWTTTVLQFEALTEADIASGMLETGGYDALVLIDNSPNPTTSTGLLASRKIKEFWEKGGGIVALDSSISFLIYWGLLPPGPEQTDVTTVYGLDKIWVYNCYERIKIRTAHPITQGYMINTVYSITQLNTFTQETGLYSEHSPDDAVYIISKLPPGATVLASNARGISYGYGMDRPDEATVVSYEPASGGRIVFITCDNVRDQTLLEMYRNAVRWVALPKERIVSVYAAADKEYMNYYDDWWNPWDQDEWKIIIILAVELGDDAFEREFRINFLIKEIGTWDSTDDENDYVKLWWEAWREIDKGMNDIKIAFTGQSMYQYGGIIPMPVAGAAMYDTVIVTPQFLFFEDNLHQHEYSHLFGAPDHNPGILDWCVMSYTWGFFTNNWCSECRSIIASNKWISFR